MPIRPISGSDPIHVSYNEPTNSFVDDFSSLPKSTSVKIDLTYYCDTLAAHGNNSVGGAQVNPSQQQDARKNSWWQDTLVSSSLVVQTASAGKTASSSSDQKDGLQKSGSFVSTITDKARDVASWIWGMITGSSQTETNELVEGFSLSPEKAQDLQKFINAMKELMRQMKIASEDSQDTFNLEALLMEIYKGQIRVKEDETTATKEWLQTVHNEKKQFNKDRLEKMDETIERAKKTKVWGTVADSATALQITALAVGVSSGWGVVALVFVVGTTADRLLDDPAKKAIASLLGNGDQETEKAWIARMELGIGIVSIAAGLGFTFAGSGATLNSLAQAFSAGASFTKGTATGIKGYLDHSNAKDQAFMLELTDKIAGSDAKIKEFLADMQGLTQGIYSLYGEARQKADAGRDLVSDFFNS